MKPRDANDILRTKGATALRHTLDSAAPIAMPAPEPPANHDPEQQSSRTEPVQNADIEIQQLASLSPTQYERERKAAAKKLGELFRLLIERGLGGEVIDMSRGEFSNAI